MPVRRSARRSARKYTRKAMNNSNQAGSSNMPVNPFRKFAVANKAFVEKKLGTKNAMKVALELARMYRQFNDNSK